jgi:predicted ATPase with chaperone activity
MPKTKPKLNEDKVRINLLLTGDLLDVVRQVQASTGCGDPASAVRYLLYKGVEGSSAAMAARRLIENLEKKLSPQELLEFAKKDM